MPGISIYYFNPPKMILELSEKVSNIALILSNSCRFWVNSNFSVRLFHPPQFIMTPPQFMIFQKFSNPSQLFRPPYYYGRESRKLIKLLFQFSSSTAPTTWRNGWTSACFHQSWDSSSSIVPSVPSCLSSVYFLSLWVTQCVRRASLWPPATHLVSKYS